jgi:hypothetical protein
VLDHLSLLREVCDRHGISPNTKDVWRAWKVFKQFARTVDEIPDPGVSVQIYENESGVSVLAFVRQVVEEDEDNLQPAGGLIWEFALNEAELIEPLELWSFDFRTFNDFVDSVEGHPAVSPLLNGPASPGELYWDEE